MRAEKHGSEKFSQSAPRAPAAYSEPQLLRGEILYIRASTLAREGNYAGAERLLLAELQKGVTSTRLMDLLARVYAQCGHMRAARELWNRIQSLVPGESRSTAALAAISEMEDCAARVSVRKPDRRYRIAIAAMLFALVLAILLFFGRKRHSTQRFGRTLPPAAPPIRTASANSVAPAPPQIVPSSSSPTTTP